MKTFAAARALVIAALISPTDDPTIPWVEVYAPCCGRRTAADSILDVRAVPGTVVRGGGHQAPRDHEWLCDGCRQRLYADRGNDWTRSRLYSAVGSDPDHVRFLYARELAELVAMLDHRHDRRNEHRPGGVLETILEGLPAGLDPHRGGPQ